MLLCPACMVEMQITERQGVEIDHCPQCRGVWLERGELDKILERARRVPSSRHDDDDDERYRHEGASPRRHDDDDDEQYRHGGASPRRRKSFLENLFDF
jgi:uncharacterized protein